MIYKIFTDLSFEEVLDKFEKTAKEKGFSTLNVYNFTEILKEKGFPIDKQIAVFEICNPKFAKEALENHSDISMFLPCKVSLVNENGKTSLSILEPQEILVLLKTEDLKNLFEEVDSLLKEILNQFKTKEEVS
jgi:uncharacterized protein (DUF302 family)